MNTFVRRLVLATAIGYGLIGCSAETPTPTASTDSQAVVAVTKTSSATNDSVNSKPRRLTSAAICDGVHTPYTSDSHRCGNSPAPNEPVVLVTGSGGQPINTTSQWVSLPSPIDASDANSLTPHITKPLPSVRSRRARVILQSALTAYQTKLEVIANNLANVDTTAFKSRSVVTEDAAYRSIKMPGSLDSAGQPTTQGVSIGGGCQIAAVRTNFAQGALKSTSSQLDVAIVGHGFFQVTAPTGETLFTRAGAFSINANGQVVMASSGIGRPLEPPITIPSDATDIVISPEGVVSVRQAGNPTLTQAGQIQLAKFVNPEGLISKGENLYSESGASNTATTGNPGQQGIGTLRQSTLEASNVEPVVQELDLIQTVRMIRTLEGLLR